MLCMCFRNGCNGDMWDAEDELYEKRGVSAYAGGVGAYSPAYVGGVPIAPGQRLGSATEGVRPVPASRRVPSPQASIVPSTAASATDLPAALARLGLTVEGIEEEMRREAHEALQRSLGPGERVSGSIQDRTGSSGGVLGGSRGAEASRDASRDAAAVATAQPRDAPAGLPKGPAPPAGGAAASQALARGSAAPAGARPSASHALPAPPPSLAPLRKLHPSSGRLSQPNSPMGSGLPLRQVGSPMGSGLPLRQVGSPMGSGLPLRQVGSPMGSGPLPAVASPRASSGRLPQRLGSPSGSGLALAATAAAGSPPAARRLPRRPSSLTNLASVAALLPRLTNDAWDDTPRDIAGLDVTLPDKRRRTAARAGRANAGGGKGEGARPKTPKGPAQGAQRRQKPATEAEKKAKRAAESKALERRREAMLLERPSVQSVCDETVPTPEEEERARELAEAARRARARARAAVASSPRPGTSSPRSGLPLPPSPSSPIAIPSPSSPPSPSSSSLPLWGPGRTSIRVSGPETPRGPPRERSAPGSGSVSDATPAETQTARSGASASALPRRLVSALAASCSPRGAESRAAPRFAVRRRGRAAGADAASSTPATDSDGSFQDRPELREHRVARRFTNRVSESSDGSDASPTADPDSDAGMQRGGTTAPGRAARRRHATHTATDVATDTATAPTPALAPALASARPASRRGAPSPGLARARRERERAMLAAMRDSDDSDASDGDLDAPALGWVTKGRHATTTAQAEQNETATILVDSAGALGTATPLWGGAAAALRRSDAAGRLSGEDDQRARRPVSACSPAPRAPRVACPPTEVASSGATLAARAFEEVAQAGRSESRFLSARAHGDAEARSAGAEVWERRDGATQVPRRLSATDRAVAGRHAGASTRCVGADWKKNGAQQFELGRRVSPFGLGSRLSTSLGLFSSRPSHAPPEPPPQPPPPPSTAAFPSPRFGTRYPSAAPPLPSRSPSPSPRSRLAARLARLGLVRVPVVGDGNCLFRALSFALHGTESRHVEVRGRVVAALRRDAARFGPFLVPSPRRYLVSLEAPGTWGDEPCLQAAAEAFGVEVHVVSSDRGDRWELRYEPREPRRRSSAGAWDDTTGRVAAETTAGPVAGPKSPPRGVPSGDPESARRRRAAPAAHARRLAIAYLAPIHYDATRARSSSNDGIEGLEAPRGPLEEPSATGSPGAENGGAARRARVAPRKRPLGALLASARSLRGCAAAAAVHPAQGRRVP